VLFWAPLLIDAMLKGEFSGIGTGPAAPPRALTPKETARPLRARHLAFCLDFVVKGLCLFRGGSCSVGGGVVLRERGTGEQARPDMQRAILCPGSWLPAEAVLIRGSRAAARPSDASPSAAGARTVAELSRTASSVAMTHCFAPVVLAPQALKQLQAFPHCEHRGGDAQHCARSPGRRPRTRSSPARCTCRWR